MSDDAQTFHIKNKNTKVKKNCQKEGPFDVRIFYIQISLNLLNLSLNMTKFSVVKINL